MTELMTILQNLEGTMSAVALRQLMVIVPAVLAMSGQVTMLNISRWTGEGGSYKTIQRFYNTQIVWLQVNWALMSAQFGEQKGTYLLVGDETTVTKAGKKTHGLDRFFSSIYGKAVRGLSFLGVSLVSVEEKTSTMLLMEQLTREKSTSPKTPGSTSCKEKPSQKKVSKKTIKSKGGRPKGSKNKNRRDIELPAHLQNIQNCFKQVLEVTSKQLTIKYAVLDGAFGNNAAVQMVRRLDLHLVSKLNRNAALFFPYMGEYSGKGRPRIYGDKLNYDQIPQEHLEESLTEDGTRTDIYCMTMRHKLFPDPLRIVLIVKTKLDSGQRAHVVLFSTDTSLSGKQIMQYYSLRFQIEFNFRDAKQYWGLEHFMNVNERPVYNAANFALFMVNLTALLLKQRRSQHCPDFGVHDLKSEFHGHFYAQEAIKLLPETPDESLIDAIFSHFGSIGTVHS
ncbi:MAG: transposase [Chloroflexota bacterium]